MPNRLASETSPYLQEHAENPVDWYPWSDEALARARRDNKPILLSIGYSACHWCHVMARESFEDPEVAALMNRDFVNIKVDREERPDLDQIYMRAVQAMTGSGGWPMTVFLLPDQTPFFAGTYFPPSDRFGMPAFRRVLAAVSDAFSRRPTDVERTASRVRDYLRSPGVALDKATLSPALLDTAYEHLARDYDAADGGFGGAPKFPQAMATEFLLRTDVRRGSPQAKTMAVRTLESMAEGGIYDQLGGGFHRYAVDAHWLVPHFEKMLYDNALLVRVYVDAWQLTGIAAFRRTAEETISFVLRELRSPEGGFYSSLDADSEGEEGLFYLWTPRQLGAVLGPADAIAVADAFGVSEAGNFEGRNILHAVTPEAPAILDRVRERLMAARSQRVRPHRDEKVLAGWNGLMLRALADAGRVLDREDLVSVAEANARFLLTRMREGARMRRSYKDGRAPLAGFLEDQASVADGLLSLYEATFDRGWLDEFRALVGAMLSAFWDDDRASFFDTAADHEQLVARPQDFTDNAIPSGTSLAVDVLLRGGMLLGEDTWVRKARTVLEALGPTAARAPLAFGRLLAALDFELGNPAELAFIGDPAAAQMKALLDVARNRYLPNHLIAADSAGATNRQIPLLAGRSAIGGQPTAYLCEGFVCQAPTSDPTELARQLDRFSVTS